MKLETALILIGVAVAALLVGRTLADGWLRLAEAVARALPGGGQ